MLRQLGAQRSHQQALFQLFARLFLAQQIVQPALALQQLIDNLAPNRLSHIRYLLYQSECLTAPH